MSVALLSPAIPLILPVSIREQHVFSMEMTENPVETGASLNDHYIRKPRELTLEVAAEIPQLVWQAFLRIRNDARPFTVVTGLDIYRNMLVKDVSVSRTKDNAKIFSGTIALKESIFARTARTAATGASETEAASERGGAKRPTARNTPSGTPTQDRATSTVHRGDNPTAIAPTEGNSPEAVQNRSILKGILG